MKIAGLVPSTRRHGPRCESDVLCLETRIHRGDFVEVRSAVEILETLDADGTLDHLPFMPEMVEYCGKRFRVLRRAEQICTDRTPVPAGESRVRGFAGNDVVLLDGLRCSGLQHDGCNRGCTIFWKEAWLRKVDDCMVQRQTDEGHADQLRARLKNFIAPGVCFCQSSELLKTTHRLSRGQRIRICFRAVVTGNYGLGEMLRLIAIWVYWRAHHALVGAYPRGDRRTTPTETLNLQLGEWVEVKSLQEITATLDTLGRNRGLHFTPDMRLRCGQRYPVRTRVAKIVAEGTGEVRQLRDTVILEGAMHFHTYYAFGGCPRCDYQYWKEIWLRRVSIPTNAPHHGHEQPAVQPSAAAKYFCPMCSGDESGKQADRPKCSMPWEQNPVWVAPTATNVISTSPMKEHGDVISDKPGNCPKCGTTLVKTN